MGAREMTAAELSQKVLRRARRAGGLPARVLAYRRFVRETRGPQDREVFERLRLVPGLDNGSAHATLLCEAYHRALESGGDVLECGPGLSTLVLEAATRQTGARVHSLEHSVFWTKRTSRLLTAVGARQVELHHSPIRSHGDFEWYTVPADLPEHFALVLCDGPPGIIEGGRYGLLPVMEERISGAAILVDDAARPGEAAALSRWETEHGRASRVVQVGEEPALGIIEPVVAGS